MSFEKLNALLLTSLIVFVIYIAFWIYDKKLLSLVQKYWSLRLAKKKVVANVLLTLSLVFFVLAAGDLRGREEVIESSVPMQKTVVLIDSSASMLVEDIRPNRLRKAILIARHFIRNSFGHQVALSVFSDIQKKIVPFTDDIQILESRLQNLVDTDIKGSSNLTLAIREAAQYFKTATGYSHGNILLLTDGEEHSSIDISLPKEISLAVVGLGSENGGRIPVRDRNGNFSRYKTWNGKEVTSKLNKKYFDNLVEKVENGKVWIAQSYSMPTKEILDFFTVKYKEAFTKGTFKQRTVKGHVLIILGAIFYILSVVISRFKTFAPVAVLALFLLSPTSSRAQNTDDISILKTKMKNGEITKEERKYLAYMLLKQREERTEAAEEQDEQIKQNSMKEKGVTLYESTLENPEQEEVVSLFNLASGYLQTKQLSKGIELYHYLLSRTDISEQDRQRARDNIRLALKQQKGGGKGKSDKDKKDQNKDKKDNSGDGQGNDKKKNKKKNGKDDKKDQKDKDGKNKDQQNDPNDPKNKKNDWDKIKNDAQKKKAKANVKGVLKQIMNDDSNLQKKFLDTSSQTGQSNLKDW
jgi:Ca-activated chloride channel family protein